MMQKNEKIFLSIIIGYFFTIFSIVVFGVVIPDKTSLSMSFVAGFSNFAFMIPLIIAGVGVWLPWIGIIYGQFPTSGNESILVLSFWILSMVSIPITIILSKGIPLWRRIPYVYFIAVLISGTAIWLWTGFGN